MNEDKLEIAIQNGIRARQLLESDAFRTTVHNLRNRLFKDWTATTDRDLRDKLWFDYRATTYLEAELQQSVSNGKVAERQLQEKLNG